MNSIIQNLKAAREIISAAAPDTVDLSRYGTRTQCGTLYCSLGHIAASGLFKDNMQLKWQVIMQLGEQVEVANMMSPHGSFVGDRVLDQLFGYDSFLRLFATRECGTWDRLWREKGSDRDLALWRIDQQLKLLQLFALSEVEELVFGMGADHLHKLFVEWSLLGRRRSTLQVSHHNDVLMWSNHRKAFMNRGQAAAMALERAGHEVDMRVFSDDRTTTLELSIKEAA